MQFARVVLKPQATWAEVQSTGVDTADWEECDSTPVLQDEPHLNWWKSAGGDCVIAYVQDPLREFRCYHLTGADREAHVAIIRGGMPTFDREEIGAMMAGARTAAEQIVAVYHAAASASSELDPAIFDFLARSVADSKPAVRRAAVDATLVALWPDLRALLERVAAADPDADLRVFARETLTTLQTRAWGAAPGEFDFVPLPPDRRRITPLTWVRDVWYEAAFGQRPKPQAPERNPRGESGTTGKRASGQQVKFVFNYHECHARDVPPGGWAGVRAFVRQLKERDWEQQGPGADDLSGCCDPEIRTIDDLRDRAREYFVDENHQPEDVVQIPFDKLAALMAPGGWSFVGGDFLEFEGNHNDSELTVVLERASGA